MSKLSIRGGNGLGDAIYIQSIARHLLRDGHPVEVCTRWPDVFSQLKGPVTLSSFRRDKIDRLCHYTSRKYSSGTDQFKDCCLQAGIVSPVELDLGWEITDHDLAQKVRGDGSKPVVAVALPRRPMGRTDGFGKEILPSQRAYQAAIDEIRGKARLVMVGGGHPEYIVSGADLDLVNKTTVKQLFDVACACDGFLGYCSYLVPLAEALKKPGLFVWSRRGLTCNVRFVRAITPAKVLHRRSSISFIDDCGGPERVQKAAQFLDAITGRGKV